MSDLTPTQMGNRIANSLTGYIAHIPGSVSCRHCELAQEIADALRAVEQATWKEAAKSLEARSTCPEDCGCPDRKLAAEFRVRTVTVAMRTSRMKSGWQETGAGSGDVRSLDR